MPDRNDVAARIKDVVDQRVALETTLQNEVGEPSEASAASYDARYGALQKQLAALFKETVDDGQRIPVRPGNVYLIPAGTEHAVEHVGEAEFVNFCLWWEERRDG